MNTLSTAGLVDLAGVTEAEVQRLVELGILAARDMSGWRPGRWSSRVATTSAAP